MYHTLAEKISIRQVHDAVPRIRQALLDRFAASVTGSEEYWGDLQVLRDLPNGLDHTPRIEELLKALKEQADSNRAGDSVQLTLIMQLVDTIADETQEFLRLDSFERTPGVGRFAERRRELAAERARVREQTRDAILERLKDHVYNNPGQYLKQIHDELSSSGQLNHQYQTTVTYLNLLEARGIILTVGGHQGRPRRCFPHPNCMARRTDYLGRKFGIQGSIKATPGIEDSLPVMMEAYIVNSAIDPILLVTPFGLAMKAGEPVGAFGTLVPIEASEQLDLDVDALREAGLNELVKADYLEHGQGNRQVEDIPKWFRHSMIGAIQ